MGEMYGADADNKLLPANVSYVMHNPRLCADASSLKYIVYLHSAPGNSERRDLVRQTWGNRQLLKDQNSRVVFLLGLPKNNDTQETLRAEFAQHGDIVQGNFHDDYRNLTLKGIMGLKWISTYCAQAQYALKSDDDAFVNIFSLLGVMDGNADKKRLIACVSYPAGSMPILRYPRKCFKWCIKYREMIGRHGYPQYCAGVAFLLSREMVSEMYAASLKTPFFWVDDAYVSGLLPAKVNGVERVALNSHFSLQGRDAYEAYMDPAIKEVKYYFVHGMTIKQRVMMWCALLRKLNETQKALLSDDVMINSTVLLSHYMRVTTAKLPRVI
ncbi:Lactosylceramide 1,3-N-acetyl-beta-D-glucosaminyltransferase A [Lamellibrachia satsuma]|nr:Lactosylceramide 1,3-N-acetyl-beta-D-glucosaminyltransferase A [Lamellibrachia satsuma]